MSEHKEACTLHQMLTLMKIEHWHIPQEIWTPSYNQKVRQKKEGFKSGLSDYIVIIPSHKAKSGHDQALFIELKKPKVKLKRASKNGKAGDLVPDSSSKATKEQLEFISMVAKVAGVEAEVCYGADDAINYVRGFLK